MRNIIITQITQEIVPANQYYPGKREDNTEQSKALALREAKRIGDTDFSKLWRYYYETKKEIQLDERTEEMRKRLANIWQLLTGRVLNDRKAVQAHVIWCRDNYLRITERTAHDDLRRAKMLYGDPSQSMAIFEKARISAVLLSLIEKAKELGEKCSDEGMYDIAAKHFDSASKLIRRYNAVNGIETDLKSQVPRAPIVINFNADPETLKKQASDLMQGVAQDIDFDDLR
jgi:tetratricopeptide (TPR) repeat protein